MNYFNPVDFGPDEVKAVTQGTAPRSTMLAVLTSQTCGEPCWHAREEVCRCSCGGKNHGCLNNGGERPERTAKIDGERYRLFGVGLHKDLYNDSYRINREHGFRFLDVPFKDQNGLWHQYYYTWSETDVGAPARLKTASASQRAWAELAGWKDAPEVRLLWTRVQMPERPKNLRIGDDGLPLVDQNPK